MKYAEIEWKDGTPRNREYDDVYFSAGNGLEETRYVFMQHNRLHQRWRDCSRFVIGETGFGTGLNFLVTVNAWLQARDNGCLHYISIENAPVSPADIRRVVSAYPDLEPVARELLDQYPPAVNGMHLLELAGGRVRLYLLFDDVGKALESIDARVDAWYLDGFAPARNRAMWTEEVFAALAGCSASGCTFATYTASGDVRRGLAAAGFDVSKHGGFGSKRA